MLSNRAFFSASEKRSKKYDGLQLKKEATMHFVPETFGAHSILGTGLLFSSKDIVTD